MSLAALTQTLGEAGLFIVRPVSQAVLDRAGVTIDLASMMPEARTAIVVGDGGGAFFAGFARFANAAAVGSLSNEANPLDRYTAHIIGDAVKRAFGSQPFALRFPFDARGVAVPMQQIGQASGIPAPGPLGLQIHPLWGPWWAYRALVLVSDDFDELPPLAPSCPGCAEPCVHHCPVQAPNRAGFRLGACVQRRLVDVACAQACAARSACVIGTVHHYPQEQVAFHTRASLAMIRAHVAGSSGIDAGDSKPIIA